MNRRSFLRSMVGGLAAAAAVRTFPFRVFSFPQEIVVPSLEAQRGFSGTMVFEAAFTPLTSTSTLTVTWSLELPQDSRFIVREFARRIDRYKVLRFSFEIDIYGVETFGPGPRQGVPVGILAAKL